MEATRQNAKESGTRRSLLLVDPDPLLRWSIQAHLSAWFSVDAVASATEAESMLRQKRFDAIVLSASPAGLSQRLEAAARRCNPTVRIVRLVTDRQVRREDASVAYLEKPFRLDALAHALDVGP
jgi:DNA-binding response OmpR family regulator